MPCNWSRISGSGRNSKYDVGGGRVRKSSTVRELFVRLSIFILVHITETIEHLKLLIQNGRRGERKASLMGNTKTQ